MRGGWWLVALCLALAAAGCVGGLEEEPEAELEQADAQEAFPDLSRPASEEANLTTRLPIGHADARAPGPSSVDEAEYDFGPTLVTEANDGPAYKAQLAGSMTYPLEGDELGVVVLVHGRHDTCEDITGDRRYGTPECPNIPPVMEEIPSYQGYRYIADTLASHGFLVVSVDANDVNDRDSTGVYIDQEPIGPERIGEWGIQPRAQLVLRTLDRIEEIQEGSDPGPVPGEHEALVEALAGRLDLSTVGLVGHSRGGDGVNYAVPYNDARAEGAPHDIDAVFAIAPTDFLDTSVPGVAHATLLPYCDGDVYDLWGAHVHDRSRYLDDAGPLYQYVAMGSNHAFYNTVWTEAIDDASGYEDPLCGERRSAGGGHLDPADQRRHGEALVNAFLRKHLADETGFEPWLQGRETTPPSACPEATSPCPGLIHTSYQPPAGERLVVEAVEDGQALDANDLGGTVDVSGDLTAEVCTPPECPSDVNRQLATQLHLAWEGEGRYALEIPDDVDLVEHAWLSVRLGANPDQPVNDRARQDVSVALATPEREDSVSADAYGHPLYVPIGEEDGWRSSLDVTLSSARIPLDAFDVELADVEEVAIVTDRTEAGSIQIADIMLQR